jgi:aspartate racemase
MQKLVGMIGGVSWESSALYYKLMNEAVREKFGGLNSAKLLIYSLNYDPIVALERKGNWQAVADILMSTARDLERAGAAFIILGCNTLHKVAKFIENAVNVPFLHIADAVGEALQKAGVKKVGLLGTQFTMEEGFYASRLQDKFQLEVITPPLLDRQVIDRIIYQELCVGKQLDSSRQKMSDVMQALADAGAQGIILGCTEFGMLVQEGDSPVPTFDSTILHAAKAVALALG